MVMNNFPKLMLHRQRNKNYVVLRDRGGEVVVTRGYESGKKVLLAAATKLVALAASSIALAGRSDKFSCVAAHEVSKAGPSKNIHFCACGNTMEPTGQYAFVEFGEYDGKRYDTEGNGEIFRCSKCSRTVVEFPGTL